MSIIHGNNKAWGDCVAACRVAEPTARCLDINFFDSNGHRSSSGINHGVIHAMASLGIPVWGTPMYGVRINGKDNLAPMVGASSTSPLHDNRFSNPADADPYGSNYPADFAPFLLDESDTGEAFHAVQPGGMGVDRDNSGTGAETYTNTFPDEHQMLGSFYPVELELLVSGFFVASPDAGAASLYARRAGSGTTYLRVTDASNVRAPGDSPIQRIDGTIAADPGRAGLNVGWIERNLGSSTPTALPWWAIGSCITIPSLKGVNVQPFIWRGGGGAREFFDNLFNKMPTAYFDELLKVWAWMAGDDGYLNFRIATGVNDRNRNDPQNANHIAFNPEDFGQPLAGVVSSSKAGIVANVTSIARYVASRHAALGLEPKLLFRFDRTHRIDQDGSANEDTLNEYFEGFQDIVDTGEFNAIAVNPAEAWAYEDFGDTIFWDNGGADRDHIEDSPSSYLEHELRLEQDLAAYTYTATGGGTNPALRIRAMKSGRSPYAKRGKR